MIDKPDNGINTGLFGQWGTPAPGGNTGANTPTPTQPALFNLFPVPGRGSVLGEAKDFPVPGSLLVRGLCFQRRNSTGKAQQ